MAGGPAGPVVVVLEGGPIVVSVVVAGLDVAVLVDDSGSVDGMTSDGAPGGGTGDANGDGKPDYIDGK